MTGPDYVAQAAELLGEHADCGASIPHQRMTCGMALPKVYGNASFSACHKAEVLAAAGLIPTRTEWGVRGVETSCVYDHHDGWTEQDARDQAAVDRELTLISRPAHDWKDATDE